MTGRPVTVEAFADAGTPSIRARRRGPPAHGSRWRRRHQLDGWSWRCIRAALDAASRGQRRQRRRSERRSRWLMLPQHRAWSAADGDAIVDVDHPDPARRSSALLSVPRRHLVAVDRRRSSTTCDDSSAGQAIVAEPQSERRGTRARRAHRDAPCFVTAGTAVDRSNVARPSSRPPMSRHGAAALVAGVDAPSIDCSVTTGCRRAATRWRSATCDSGRDRPVRA